MIFRLVVSSNAYVRQRVRGRAQGYRRFILTCRHFVVAKMSAGFPSRKRCKECERAGERWKHLGVLIVLVLSLLSSAAGAGPLYESAAAAGNRIDPFPVPLPKPFATYQKAFALDVSIAAAGAVAAIWTTEDGLARCAACREGNPAVHSLRDRVVLRSLILGARAGLSWYLRRNGRDRAADRLRYVGLAVDVVDSARNVYITEANR